jgi:hypothetical protein
MESGTINLTNGDITVLCQHWFFSRLKIETSSGFLNDHKPKYIELADVT